MGGAYLQRSTVEDSRPAQEDSTHEVVPDSKVSSPNQMNHTASECDSFLTVVENFKSAGSIYICATK